ncbi:MAG: 3-hydroxyacyl-CoA dehydrogenase NAD-binding domain-containing protein [Cardiobacteriaceae bacterium]|nr:3-hydroxyacyl-CoA dehydrogenase NAD-binding domain-containing protein [Cardiobacteriaceae bacterium]
MPYQSPAILGATLLGGQLATLFANAGLRVRLYDKPHPQDPNLLGRQLINRLLSEYPSASLSVEASSRIDVRNYRDHLNQLQSHDLIIDCSEDLLHQKQGLWVRLAPTFAKPTTLISHLESSRVQDLASALPAGRRQHFFGAHFTLHQPSQRFVELITHERSEMRLCEPLARYFQEALNCPSLWIPDQANHVVNRLALFLLTSAYHHATKHNLNHHETELLTQLIFGHYGVGYVADCLGLSRLKMLYQQACEYEKPFFLAQMHYPKRFERLVQKGHEGRTKGLGIYDHRHDPAQFASPNKIPPPLDSALIEAYQQAHWQALTELPSNQAKFVRDYLENSYQYAMHLCEALKLDGNILDQLTRHAFGWNTGLYEQYQRFGAHHVLATSAHLPYAISRYWNPRRARKKSPEPLPIKALTEKSALSAHLQLIKQYPHSTSFHYSKSLTLWQPKSHDCALNPAELHELLDTLQYARNNQSALLIHHHGNSFGQPFQALSAQEHDMWLSHHLLLNQVIMALRLNPFPIYLSIAGQVYDHGYALLMQMDQILCNQDTHFHLTTLAQQLPSVGGVWLEWLRRLPSIDEDNHLSQIHSVFKYLLQNPSHQAPSARHVGILRDSDTLTHHTEQLRQLTESQLAIWSQASVPRSLRYGRASLSTTQLTRLLAYADRTANPSLYRDLLGLLNQQQQNHSISLSTLLGHELSLLEQRLFPHLFPLSPQA